MEAERQVEVQPGRNPKLLLYRQAGNAKAISEKAEVTDADEAFGQHVQTEAA